MVNGKKVVAGAAGAALMLVAAWLGVGYEDEQGRATPTTASPTTPTTPNQSPASRTTAQESGPNGNVPSCALETLPDQTELVVDDILAGGPFGYPDNDGVRFGNYEGALPEESRNYYREYTVPTPGLGHRGPLRIVTGGGTQTDPDVWYFTGDHYETFCTITDAEG